MRLFVSIAGVAVSLGAAVACGDAVADPGSSPVHLPESSVHLGLRWPRAS